MRNYARFQDKIDVSKAILVIKDLICLVGNSSKASNTRIRNVLRPLLVIWEFPALGWVKINTNGAAKGYPGLTTCGGIFRGSMRDFIGVFSVFLEVQTAMVADFYGVIHVMEEAQKMGPTNVCLECDYALVCAAFTARTNVLWMLRNRWNTCLNYCGKIRFRVTHIFREGNVCANKLANLRFIHR